jgi:type I site-specific restriction endonuclease
MNEAETRAEQIAPALKAAGWGVVEGSRILREYTLRSWATNSLNAPSGSKLDSVGCSF